MSTASGKIKLQFVTPPRRLIGRRCACCIMEELSQALSAIASGVFSPDDPRRYAELIGGLYDHDWFMVAADFDAYTAAQRQIDARWNDARNWRSAAVLNVANVGWFSSDRTIREYAGDIWGLV